MVILSAKNLTKEFNEPTKRILFKDIDIEVEKGETLAIGGRSGEGKSTLLHLLGTLDLPSEGEIYIAGQRATPFNTPLLRNQYIGFVFQSYYLLEDFSLLENVLMAARIARKPIGRSSPSYRFAEELLAKVGLSDKRHQLARQLSGGEKQRAAVARALINNPSILLADEPTGNLDFQNSQQIQQLLFSFAEEKKMALIIVSHDEQLLRLCKRRYQLDRGAFTEH